MFFRAAERLYKDVVKTTADGKQTYLVSYHRSDAKEMRHGEVIRKEREEE